MNTLKYEQRLFSICLIQTYAMESTIVHVCSDWESKVRKIRLSSNSIVGDWKSQIKQRNDSFEASIAQEGGQSSLENFECLMFDLLLLTI